MKNKKEKGTSTLLTNKFKGELHFLAYITRQVKMIYMPTTFAYTSKQPTTTLNCHHHIERLIKFPILPLYILLIIKAIYASQTSMIKISTIWLASHPN
jgi:hypothetical protein